MGHDRKQDEQKVIDRSEEHKKARQLKAPLFAESMRFSNLVELSTPPTCVQNSLQIQI